jgi:hypothetical protein
LAAPARLVETRTPPRPAALSARGFRIEPSAINGDILKSQLYTCRDRAGRDVPAPNLHHPACASSAELVNPAGIVIAGRSFRRLHGLRDRRVNP